jgi:hypothetical protein
MHQPDPVTNRRNEEYMNNGVANKTCKVLGMAGPVAVTTCNAWGAWLVLSGICFMLDKDKGTEAKNSKKTK